MKKLNYIWIVVVCVLLAGCGKKQAKQQIAQDAPVFPDYKGVTVPANIAPLDFGVEGATDLVARFSIGGKEVMEVTGGDHVEIPEKAWRELLQKNKGATVSVTLSVWDSAHPDGATYKPFTIHISPDEITPWIAYRLIPPGYEEWAYMGIYQRDLTSFTQKPIITNRQNNRGCVNCHSFCGYSPQAMMFHARGKGGGTVVLKDGKLQKIDLASMGPQKSGTYPMWHPSGRFIVYSSNKTRQSFYGHCQDKIEVYDLMSDLIVYDTRRQTVLADKRFNDSINWETFPAFSPDGRSLYFCTGKAVIMPVEYNKLHYSICRVPFDPNTGELGAPINTVYSAARQGGSASFPRISPDGKYLLFTLADCGTFPIQHREADLKMIDLATGRMVNTDVINSRETDSYHSWSNTGRWIIFSSRRIDGRYTRLFITHFENGKFTKPFLLPQRDPKQNGLLMYSYNIPEFIAGEVKIPRDKMADLFKVTEEELKEEQPK
jgi:hypothetical protein